MNILVTFLFVCSVFGGVKDKIWPYPKSITTTTGGSSLNMSSFAYTLYDEKTEKYIPLEQDSFVSSFVDRYEKWVFSGNSGPGIKVDFKMTVKDISERNLALGNSEDYQLDVTTTGITLSATSIFGLLYGMETLTQMTSDCVIEELPLSVTDTPRYQWRGLMIDVSRHYLAVDVVKSIIDGMSFNKLNTLHLHITDDQSFPPVIDAYPLLSEKGSYDKKYAVYSKEVMKDFYIYAYERGVRIVPEVDIPGHSQAFGKGYPDIVANCPSFGKNTLNPINSESLNVVNAVVDELGEIFQDEYFHFGGDELNFGCWNEDETIAAYMKAHNYTGPDLESEFMDSVFKHTKKITVGWSDRFTQEAKYSPPENSIAEVWRGLGDINKIGALGLNMINSAGWYLDVMCPLGKTHYFLLDGWLDMYSLELDDHTDEKYRDLLIGGEGCMWGEQINDFAVIPRIFPRGCSFAERLWSQKSQNIGNLDADDVATRLNNHACNNLVQRGVHSSFVRPSYCPH